MARILLRALMSALPFLSTVYSWDIDTKSCKGADVDYVTASINRAFDLAQTAETVLDDPANVPNYPQTLKDVLFNLFIPPPDPPAANPVQDEIDRLLLARGQLRRMYGRILYPTMKTKGSMDKNPNVMFYCNVDRFVQRLDGRWYDPDSHAVLEEHESPKKRCTPPKNPKAEVTENTVFAFTTTEGSFYTINICPWILDFSAENGMRKSYNLRTYFTAMMIRWSHKFEEIVQNQYTPVDGLAFFDKLLLHELTHTEGRTDDVGGVDGYGWKNCKRIARTDDQGRWRNADSYALFGLCADLIVNQGKRIDDNGRVA